MYALFKCDFVIIKSSIVIYREVKRRKLTMNLLIPLTMIIFGKYFSKHAPKNINGIFGYRTFMSTINKETWKFAHNYCGRIWFYMGSILLIISAIGMLFLMKKNKDIIKNFNIVLTIMQMIFLLSPIVLTELALKKNFDTKGNRKRYN